MSGIGKHCCKNKREWMWRKTYHTELVFAACYCNPRRATLQINKLVASLATNGHRVPLPTRPNARGLATRKTDAEKLPPLFSRAYATRPNRFIGFLYPVY